MSMEVYHYTRDYTWRWIKNQKDHGNGVMCGDYGWTFALLEPEPEDWVNNTRIPNAWEALMRHVGTVVHDREIIHVESLVLLAIEVDLDDPNVFVADLGEMGNVGGNDLKLIFSPTERLRQTQIQQQALDAYSGSRVPISEYLERKEDLGFQLPEVHIGGDIPLSNVRAHNYQPAVERMIETSWWTKGDLLSQKFEASWQARILNLDEWYVDYCMRRPEIKIGLADYLQIYRRRLFHKLHI